MPHTTTVTLELSEYEASVIIGALAEFGRNWTEERETAVHLQTQVEFAVAQQAQCEECASGTTCKTTLRFGRCAA